jgi:hypothetical protein
MFKAKILSLLLLVFMIGCGPPPITEGKVSNKKFVAAHTDTMLVPQFDFDMNFTHMETVEDHIPDKWYITFQNDDNEQSEMRKRTITVSKSRYNDYKIGDWIELK